VSEARARVESFVRQNPHLFLLLPDQEDRSARIVETGTGKALHVEWGAVADAVERDNPLRQSPYLVLVFDDGRQVALADVGFAFAPSVVNTGPLPDLPATFCFRDFRHLTAGVRALLADEGREGEALSAVMLAIALLDGARALNFDISGEERELDSLLRHLEERGARV
jgi:hypothetical protein